MKREVTPLKRIIIVTVIMLLGAVSGLARAAIVEGLYEAEVPVTNQGDSERDRAMSLALAQVITKVSGNVQATQMPAFQDVLKNPSQYMQQFRYKRLPASAATTSSAAPGQPAAPTELAWFRFDQHAVNRLLRGNGLPVWGKTRPATLAWIAVEQDGSRFILGGDSNEDLKQALTQDAKRNGLALVFPLLDLDDQRNLTFADIWGGFQSAITDASERYQPDAILVGRLSLSSSDQWSARWSLYQQGQSQDWSGQYSTINDVLQAGTTGTLTILAKRYAQVFSEDEPGVFRISVDGVNNLKDFARLSHYLKSLEQVKNVHVTRVDPGSASFRLNIRGSSQGLVQTIALGNTLVVAPAATVSTAGSDSTSPMMPEMTSPTSDNTVAAASEYHYRMLP